MRTTKNPIESYFGHQKIDEKTCIYSAALKKQLKAIEIKGPENKSDEAQVEKAKNEDPQQSRTDALREALKRISLLETQLEEEKAAKMFLLDTVQKVNRKYYKALTMLSKAQHLLLERKHNDARESGEDERNRDPEREPQRERENGKENKTHTSMLPTIATENVRPLEFLTEDEIKNLEVIRKEKHFDATFIREAIMLLYKNKNDLKTRTLSGRSSKNSQNYTKFSPNKLLIIYYYFFF